MPEPMIGTYYAGGVKTVNPAIPKKSVGFGAVRL